MSVQDWNQNYRQQKQDGNIERITSAYNFVPLSETVVLPDWAEQASHDRPFEDGVSGVLTLTIKNHSPLLVGVKDGTSVTPFMFPDCTAGIPGSSLRGMIRNVLEIAGYGKMRLVDDKRYSVRDLTPGAKKIYREKFANNKSQSGWLIFNSKDRQWILTPCQCANVYKDDLTKIKGQWKKLLAGEIDSSCNVVPEEKRKLPSAQAKYEFWQQGDLCVSFDVGSDKKATNIRIGLDQKNGYLVFTGQPNDKKRKEFIFYNENSGQSFPVPENIMRDFQHIYQESKHWEYLKENKLFSQDRIPVFYLTEGGKISSLGLSQMYRLAYLQSVGELIDKVNDKHRKNSGSDLNLDLAELIFGTVDENDGTGSLKGRVSFSHAVCQTPPPYQQENCEAILSSPKPTYYPNYIVQNEQEGHLTGGHYRTYMDPEARIRGWKRYPVKTAITVPPLDKEQGESGAWNKLCPIKDELSFIAKLRFHNLRPVELGAIAWCLDWGGRTELRHSIGMGKPFGFGQICISIDKEDIRPNKRGSDISLAVCIDQFIKYMYVELEQIWLESEAMQHLLAMATPDNPSRKINNLIPLDLCGGGRNNQFVLAKQSSLVLKQYIQVKPPVLGAEVIWLDETLAELSKQTNTPVEKVLFTKGLAQRWQALEGGEKKIIIRALIKKRWQNKWDEEHVTGSVKIAKAIYLEEL